MIKASCHCKNVILKVELLPDSITRCNCSICYRLGVLWEYYNPDEVIIECSKAPSQAYAWGDKELEFHHCTACGCPTHYLTTALCDVDRIAINARLLKPSLIESISIRDFDGASMVMKSQV